MAEMVSGLVTQTKLLDCMIFASNKCKWGEWPSGLRHCNQNRKVPHSNSTKLLAGLRDPTLLQGSRWHSGCSLDNGCWAAK